MILAVTGHRPDKLGGFSEAVFQRLTDFAADELQQLAPSRVLTGMALGFDQAIAAACVRLGLPYFACIPCEYQASQWPADSQRRWRELCDSAERKIILSPGAYAPWKMHERNRYLVRECDKLLALHDGGESGGTAACVKYAQKKGKPIVNCWERWVSNAGETHK